MQLRHYLRLNKRLHPQKLSSKFKPHSIKICLIHCHHYIRYTSLGKQLHYHWIYQALFKSHASITSATLLHYMHSYIFIHAKVQQNKAKKSIHDILRFWAMGRVTGMTESLGRATPEGEMEPEVKQGTVWLSRPTADGNEDDSECFIWVVLTFLQSCRNIQ